MTEAASLLVEAINVNHWFGELHVLKDVNLRLKKGERIVICGPSGSGKSTFLRSLNGLEPVDRGEITIAGERLTTNAKTLLSIRSKVGMVFQNFNLFPHKTILENCIMAPIWVHNKTRKEAEETAMELLERVHIPEQANKYPAQLSGGQQQRVAIARSLCMEPEIMLFDEPTSALDPEMIAEVLDVMIELAESGMSMVCVTHKMGLAKRLASCVYFMCDGEVVEQNDPESFFSHPESARLQHFLSQIQEGHK